MSLDNKLLWVHGRTGATLTQCPPHGVQLFYDYSSAQYYWSDEKRAKVMWNHDLVGKDGELHFDKLVGDDVIGKDGELHFDKLVGDDVDGDDAGMLKRRFCQDGFQLERLVLDEEKKKKKPAPESPTERTPAPTRGPTPVPTPAPTGPPPPPGPHPGPRTDDCTIWSYKASLYDFDRKPKFPTEWL